MIYFIAIYASIAALSFADFIPKMRKICIIMSIFLLAALAGWRVIGGKDFYIYQDIYYGLSLNYTQSEIGYAVFNNLFSALGFSFNAFLFVYSFIAITLLVYFCYKHAKYLGIALLFYMSCYFFYYNMVLNRQMISLSLVLWTIYWWNNNKLYSLLCLLIGVSFHQSLCIVIPFLCVFELLQHTSGKKFWIIFFLIFVAATILFSPLQFILLVQYIPIFSFIAERLLGYFTYNIDAYALNTIEYLKMVVACLIILPWFNKIVSDKKLRIWMFFYAVGVIFLFWTRNVEILFRTFVYFDMSLLVLLPLCIQCYVDKLSMPQKGTILIFIYLFIGILAIAAILYRIAHFDNGAFLQYKFYFL